MGQRVGWERVIQQRQEMAGPAVQQRLAQSSPEQREQEERIQLQIVPIFSYLAAVAGPPFFWLINAALLVLIVKVLMSVPLIFKQVYSIVAWAALPVVVQTILKIVVLYLKKPEEFNVMNPLAFNPA